MIAAQSGSLPALLTQYGSDPELTAHLEFIRNGATELEKAGSHAAARQVLAFVYMLQLEQHDLSPSTFLGFAEIRLQESDLKSALALLRRMTLVAGGPFENLTNAAALLNKTGHSTEALEFLKQRVQAVPWDLDASEQLAQTSKDADALRAIAQSNFYLPALYYKELIRLVALSKDYLSRLGRARNYSFTDQQAKINIRNRHIHHTQHPSVFHLPRSIPVSLSWRASLVDRCLVTSI